MRARDRAKRDSLISVVVETSLEARYIFPDLTHEQFDNLMVQLDESASQLVLTNISKATLIVPFSIVTFVGFLAPLVEGKHATRLTAAVDKLWSR